jgi:flagellar biosynthesis protein FliQ
MKGFLSRFFRSVLWAFSASAVGGGILFWLSANGADPRLSIAHLLRLAQTPAYLPYTLPAAAIFFLTALIWAAYALAVLNRPSRATAISLRRALLLIQEQALDFVPNMIQANAALRNLRQLLPDLRNHRSVARRVGELLNLSDTYLLEIDAARSPDIDVASLHEKALGLVAELIDSTSWAIEEE